MAYDPTVPQLTPEEVAEAQRLGIRIPGRVGPALPRALASTLGHVSAAEQPGRGVGPAKVAPSARNPLTGGSGLVPRVQLDPVSAPENPLAKSMALQREKYNKELDDLSKPADYSQLSSQMRARSRAGMDDMYASALAGIGPEAVRGMQEPLLKQALSTRQPMKVEGGQIDESGQAMMDPGFQRNRRVEQLRLRLADLDAKELRAVNDSEKNALAHERNQVLVLLRMIQSQNNPWAQNASTWGYTPEGERVVEDRQGNQFKIGADGSRTRYTGPTIPRTAFEKNTQAAMTLQGNVNRATDLIELAKSNPEAFSLKAAAVGMTPSIIQSRIMPRVLTEEQMKVRNYVNRQAAREIHEIYGAALTMGEGKRAAQWAIEPGESVESVLTKLQAARDWAEQAMGAQGNAASNIARGRMPNSSNPAPAGKLPPGWGVREVKP